MEYTVIVNGQDYSLPKKTLKVATELDKLIKAESDLKSGSADKYRKQYDFVRFLLGDEVSKEIFRTDDINAIDFPDVTLTVKRIMDAYDKPLNDYDIEKSRNTLSEIPLDKVVELAKVAKEMSQKK